MRTAPICIAWFAKKGDMEAESTRWPTRIGVVSLACRAAEAFNYWACCSCF